VLVGGRSAASDWGAYPWKQRARSQGRVKVETDLTVPGHSESFFGFLGDSGAPGRADGGKPLLGHRATRRASSTGPLAASTISTDWADSRAIRSVSRQGPDGRRTIGQQPRGGETGKLKLGGSLPWLAWLVITLLLSGARIALFVADPMGYSYLTFARGADDRGKALRSIRKPIKRRGPQGGGDAARRELSRTRAVP